MSSSLGATRPVMIDTDEGTWISLDVSPDGKGLVFDLLGDIYSLPISGGEATALTHGIEWDQQPRFSPDGSKVAFMSDRAGTVNLWVMSRDGADLRPVSHEIRQTLAAPAWSSDGSTIAVRKEIIGKRPTGGGEIWLYHVAGGDGMRATVARSLQKDTGEPAFSPDGRFLYFSQDVSGGSAFDYGRDPAAPTYVIQRLDLENGRINAVVNGSGGSVRPTPSPDGKLMAFVRRERGRSTLYLQDLASGAQRSVYADLDLDNQETWATYDVYPSMAWTPRSESLVFWAGGKIRRLDVRTLELSDIPFRVRSTRKVFDTVKAPITVAPDEVEVKSIRWASVSPDGRSVVFQALGHLYVRSINDGNSRRLTSQHDHFEFYPAWAPDGNHIVYTTWSDVESGAVRIANVAKRTSRRMTSSSGRYVEPVFSPDGRWLVYRRARSEGLVPAGGVEEPGLYVVSTDGGAPTRLPTTGGGFPAQPHFGADPDRLYYLDIVRGDPDDTRALKSIGLTRGDEVTHFVTRNATEMRVSPDSRWFAFRAQYGAYVTPFVRTGSPIILGTQTGETPVRRLSENAQFLQWDASSGNLYWSSGSELNRRRIESFLTHSGGLFGKGSEEVAERVLDLGFEVPADRPGDTWAIRNARLITMRSDQVIEAGTVVILGNRIAAVGRSGEVDIPPEATIIEARGLTVMPGLIDVHEHGPKGDEWIIPQHNWQHHANLAFGVTTIHDPAGENETIFAAAEMQRVGLLKAPRIFSTGTPLFSSSVVDRAEINSLEDARIHVRRLKSLGAIAVKSYNQLRRDQRQQIVRAAREQGMNVNLEGGIRFHLDLSSIIDGITTLEHTLPVNSVYRDVTQLWAATRTAYTPTLIVNVKGMFAERYWYQHENVWEDSRLRAFVPPDWIDSRSRRRLMAPDEDYSHVAMAQGAKKVLDAGVKVQLGAHGMLPGLGAHWELWSLHQGGMTALECIRAGTLDAARSAGMDRDIGSLEPGKLADFLVLDRNPLDNIRNSREIRYVVQNGRLYDARTMNVLGERPMKREAFYWEKAQTGLERGSKE